MQRVLIVATIALMLGATAAEAQEQVRQRPAGPGAPNRPTDRLPPGMNRPVGPGAGNGGGRPPEVRPPRPGRPEIQPPRPGNGGPQIQPPRPGNGGPQIQPPRPGYGGPQIQPPRPGYGSGRPPHGGWNRPAVVAPRYRYPRGYGYRRWNIGFILPSVFLASSYYFNDYATLGLAPPPRGYRWVRYGPDLLLVRRKNGKIREVYYGVFR